MEDKEEDKGPRSGKQGGDSGNVAVALVLCVTPCRPFQIATDLKPDRAQKLLKQEVDLDKPGLGQFYCVHCAKHFISAKAFADHVRGKPHKRRLHALKTDPYTVEESERAAGMGSYVAPK